MHSNNIIAQKNAGLPDVWQKALSQASWPEGIPDELAEWVTEESRHVIAQLQAENPDAAQSQAIGQRLAGLSCGYPEALPLTIAALNMHFFDGDDPAKTEALADRMAWLMGHITTGYFQLYAADESLMLPASQAPNPGPFSLTLAHMSRVRLENLKRMQVIELEMVNHKLRQELAERRHVEQSLRHYNQELSKVTLAGQNVTSVLDVEQVLQTILAELHRLIKVFAYSVWLVDPDTGELVCRQATEAHRQTIVGWRLQPGQGIVGWVVAHDETVLVNDTREDERHYKKIDSALKLEVRSILSAPLRGRYGVIGVLQIIDQQPNRFSPTDQMLLQTLARSAGVAIENATLYEQTRREADAKTALLREVNRRVATNLASINSILNLKRNRIQNATPTDYQLITEEVVNQVQSLTIVYSLMSATNSPTIPLVELTSRVINASLKVLAPKKYVSVNVVPADVQITAGQAHELALVINELVTNSVKHALPNITGALKITVNLEQHQNFARLTFADNGPGYPSSLLKAATFHDNLGLELIQTVARSSLNGTFRIFNDAGATTTIEFEQSRPETADL